MNTGLTGDLLIWQGRGKTFDYRGHSIYYRDTQSDKPPLLLIHGFPTASWDWSKVWPMLEKQFRLLTLDMIGFGLSDKPTDYAYSVFDQADLYESFLAYTGINKVAILAHDYGDTVTQELLARVGDRKLAGQIGLELSLICLLNGGLFPETHRARPIQRLLNSPIGYWVSRLMSEKPFIRSMSAVFGDDTCPDHGELHSFWQGIAHNEGKKVFHKLIRYIRERKVHRQRWVGAIQRTSVPIRLIIGSTDPVSGQHMADRYRELVAEPDILMLANIGHYPQVEAPEQVVAGFYAFVQQTQADN